AKEIATMMEGYRKNPPQMINGSKVIELLDYKSGEGHSLVNGKRWKLTTPASNVLQFILEDGSKISARPSGTEPKIKFYFSVNTNLASEKDFEATEEILDKKITSIIADMKLAGS
ncbi:MAG: phospho-sugar mutase, partial [Chitinophagaceae bacterium]